MDLDCLGLIELKKVFVAHSAVSALVLAALRQVLMWAWFFRSSKLKYNWYVRSESGWSFLSSDLSLSSIRKIDCFRFLWCRREILLRLYLNWSYYDEMLIIGVLLFKVYLVIANWIIFWKEWKSRILLLSFQFDLNI